MKWLSSRDLQIGNRRKCKGFLLFPKTCNGETRWLERSEWFEDYRVVMNGVFGWDPIQWADREYVMTMDERREFMLNNPPKSQSSLNARA